MTTPAHFNCPNCMLAMQRDDPRFAVPKGESCRIIACPGCRSAIRIWAPGCDPAEKSHLTGYIITAIVIIALAAALVAYNSQAVR